jgi:hypothetical protein
VEPGAVSCTGSINAHDPNATTANCTDSVHTGLGCSPRRSESNVSTPYFDLTGIPDRLCVRWKARIKMDNSDGLVDGLVYRANKIIVHISSDGLT